MDSRQLSVFHKTVAREFAFLKQAVRLSELFARGIALPDSGGMLVPLSRLHQEDAQLPEQLVGWNVTAPFPAEELGMPQSARAWLTHLLESPGQIGFLLLDKYGQRQGFLSLGAYLKPEHAVTIGSVVGCREGNQLLAEGVRVLLLWAHDTLFPRHLLACIPTSHADGISFFLQTGLQRSGQEGGLTVLRFGPLREAAGKSLILTAGPSISAREVSYAYDAVRHGWNHEWDRYIRRFETRFAEYVGVKHALSTSSCTGALHLALLALEIGPGDEVIVPELTWVATANAVRYTGATPIFADVEEDSWCLDPESFAEKITSRTRAVIPVHLYGHPARMDAVLNIARCHGLHVIEDAAPSIGAEYQGRRTGSFGDVACFSFQGAKLLVTGEGGMLLTDNPELYRKAHKLWDQGRVPGTFWIDELGWKYKMANIQAAIGLGQLERVEQLVEAKRCIHGWYREGLASIPHLRLNQEIPGARSIYWMTSILLEEDCPLSRDQLRAELKKRNIDTRDVFPAISQYPIWPVKQPPQPRATRIGARALNLPSGVCLRREQVDYICSCLRDLLC